MIEYNDINLELIKIDYVSFGYRSIGSGEDLVFIHGFPTHGYTWRKLLPHLSSRFKCHILDMPGLGNSEWSNRSNLNIDNQAKKTEELLKLLGINRFNLLAHNSGGTIARIMAINLKEKVKNLILINTEIPNHRPPFIELYQKASRLPFASKYFQIKLNQSRFIKSSMGFKQAYSNKNMLNDESNLGQYLEPLVNSTKRIKGAFKFLRGIDWEIIDEFEYKHSKITANTLFIWGEDDKTFPIELGKKMTKQFNSKVKFKTVKNASLLPHEEKPEIVSNEIIEFIRDNNAT